MSFWRETLKHRRGQRWILGRRTALVPEDLGVIAVQLALNFPEWVRRRRIVVSYVNDTTIQQRMSVDFMLPDADWFWSTTAPAPGERIYIPIYLPAKETLDQFTAFDEDGRRLTMLPTADNGALAVAGLLPLVRGLAVERLTVSECARVFPFLEEELTKIVMAPNSPAAASTDEVLEQALAGPLGTVLTDEDETKAVVRDLAGGFLMLVPITYQPGVDRLLKAEWDIPNYWRGKRDGNGLVRWVQSCLASVGWADKRQSIPAMQIGWARSTHVEVVAPADVEMTSVSVRAEQYDPGQPGVDTVVSLRSVYNKPRATINVSPRGVLSPLSRDKAKRERAARELLQARGDTGSVEVRFRSPASGVLVAATTASAMLTALLWVSAEHLAVLDRQTFSAVLLVFPAILAAYLLRPGEHAFARRLLVGVRLCGLGVAICSVAVAALLGVAALTQSQPMLAGERISGQARLVCSGEDAPISCDSEANATTRAWARRIATVATVLAAILVIGLLRTWLWSDVRNRKKTESYVVDGPDG